VQFVTWWQATGNTDWTTLQADQDAIRTDAGLYDMNAMQSDGSQLASDAQAAAAEPPPGKAHHVWGQIMADLQREGNLLAAGDIPGATHYLVSSTSHVDRFTAIIKAMTP
jgi:hypothetical protein